MNIHVGDIVTFPNGMGTVTYVRRGASTTPLAVTVCVGPTAFDLAHPAPHEVRLAA